MSIDSTDRDNAISFITDARDHLNTAEAELMDDDGTYGHAEDYLEYADGAVADALECLRSSLDRTR